MYIYIYIYSVYVEGLSEWVVRSPREIYGLIKRGSLLRCTSSTKLNETSSRSHAIFIIILEQNEIIKEPGLYIHIYIYVDQCTQSAYVFR